MDVSSINIRKTENNKGNSWSLSIWRVSMPTLNELEEKKKTLKWLLEQIPKIEKI